MELSSLSGSRGKSHSASQARFLKGHGEVGWPGGVFSFPVGIMAAGKGTLDVAFRLHYSPTSDGNCLKPRAISSFALLYLIQLLEE